MKVSAGASRPALEWFPAKRNLTSPAASETGGIFAGGEISPRGEERVRGWVAVPPPLSPEPVESSAMASPITIVSARFEDLVAIGLESLISEDPNLELVADGVDLDRLETVLEEQKPSVVLLNFGSLPNPAMIYQLHTAHPETRI